MTLAVNLVCPIIPDIVVLEGLTLSVRGPLLDVKFLHLKSIPALKEFILAVDP